MVQSKARPRALAQRGVSLIEVLVALLVVSMGVLAVTGLLATAARYGKTSEFRSIATLLASDMADRMRANKPGVDAGSYALTAEYAELAEAPEVPACANPEACTPAELAAKDLAEWEGSLFYGLPGAAGYIGLSAADGEGNINTADIWIAWLDPAAAANETKATQDGSEECPPGFRNLEPQQPRCMYFRVGM